MHLNAVPAREQRYIDAESQPRVYSHDLGNQTFTAFGPWMDRTQWPFVYGTVRDILVALSQVPDRSNEPLRS